MITRQELEKMVEEAGHEHAGWKNIPSSSLTDSVKYHLTMIEKSFKSGAEFVMDKLMPMIEELKEDRGFWKKETILQSSARELFKEELTELKRQNDIMREALEGIANRPFDESQCVLIKLAQIALSKCGKGGSV